MAPELPIACRCHCVDEPNLAPQKRWNAPPSNSVALIFVAPTGFCALQVPALRPPSLTRAASFEGP